MRAGRVSPIAERLVERGEALFRAPRTPIRFTGITAADALLNDNELRPHAFVIACLMDRRLTAERAWSIPYELSRRLGGFSMEHLGSQPLERVREAFAHPTKLHRYDHMADVAFRGIHRIAEEYGGDAAAIWVGSPPSAEVVLRFLEFDGAGPKIATMATNILARDFKIPLADHASVDVSADVHVRRVFARLGLVPPEPSIEQVVYRARAMHASYPGIVDLPVWEIGRRWCHPTAPECGACYMAGLCPHAAAVGAVRRPVPSEAAPTKAAMDQRKLHREIDRALRAVDPMSWRGPDAPDQLEPFIVRARALLAGGDAAAALAIGEAVATPLAERYEDYEGECEVALFLEGELAPLLVAAVEAAVLDTSERAALAERWAAWDRGLERDYGLQPFVGPRAALGRKG